MNTINKKILNSLNECGLVTNDQWRNELELDIDDLVKKTNTKEKIMEVFDSYPKSIKEIFLSYFEKDIEDLTGDEEKHLFKMIYTLLKLTNFLKGKQQNIIEDYLKSILHNKDLIQSKSISKKYLFEIQILLINDEHYNHIKKIFYLIRIHSYSYREYILSADLHSINDEVDRLQYKNILRKDGFKIELIDKENIDKALDKYENSNKTEYISKCKECMILDDELVVIILREAKRSSIRKVEELVVDTAAEWTIIRFDDNCKNIKVRSSYKNVSEIADTLIRLLGAKDIFYYIPSDRKSMCNNLNAFLQKLLTTSIPGLNLIEIKINPFNIAGQPSIIIRTESKSVPLKSSLDELKSNYNGFQLFTSIDNIEYLKVKYSDGKDTHIYTLKFKELSDEEYRLVEFRGPGGSIEKRKKFVKLLKDYNIFANEGEVRNAIR